MKRFVSLGVKNAASLLPCFQLNTTLFPGFVYNTVQFIEFFISFAQKLCVRVHGVFFLVFSRYFFAAWFICEEWTVALFLRHFHHCRHRQIFAHKFFSHVERRFHRRENCSFDWQLHICARSPRPHWKLVKILHLFRTRFHFRFSMNRLNLYESNNRSPKANSWKKLWPTILLSVLFKSIYLLGIKRYLFI